FCRHCPVVPVYQGNFRVIPADIVLEDIRSQVRAGAEHISFGDPDFLNGPAHALRIVRRMHQEFPDLSYDATIKIEHIVNYPDAIAELKETGCLFILSAVEAVEDAILEKLDKGHTRADFIQALEIMRRLDMDLAPTFVAFTPWTTLDNYIELLRLLTELQLVESVAPVQLSIRLLVPAGSYILRLPEMEDIIGAFNPGILGHPWHNPDPRVDALQKEVQAWVTRAEAEGMSRPEIFTEIWRLAHAQAGRAAPPPELVNTGKTVPRLSENWYCCAEPTCEQLTSF
ncbi:MAG TPA: radical SAM protein, partial [Gammaproteobacteria bacterium]|nr:radical SAM protein [Gammaproteobacteria bacterium]